MITFGIITDGREPLKTLREIDSIKALNVPEYEIIVAGIVPYPVAEEADKVLRLVSQAYGGRLGAMRNAICDAAKGDLLVIVDDDFVFHQDFYTGLAGYAGEWDLMSCRILNPDGTRYWDWKAHANGVNWLLDYDQTHPDQSLTGGLTIMHKHVFEAVRWDDTRGFYQEEDVDFTARVKAAGFRIVFNKAATVTHDAPYTQVGEAVIHLEREAALLRR